MGSGLAFRLVAGFRPWFDVPRDDGVVVGELLHATADLDPA